SVLFDPVMPQKMQQLRKQFGVPNNTSWNDVNKTLLSAGRKVEKGDILFHKIDDELIERQVDKLKGKSENQNDYEPLKEEIDFEDFTKMDLRAGEILQAKKIEKSNKLLKIEVDLGFEERTIVSGIANDFEADSLKGQK